MNQENSKRVKNALIPAADKGVQRKRNQSQKSTGKAEAGPVRITMLGGLNEIGKNLTVFEYGGTAILIDCGLAFPDDEMFGVDIVLPDFSYIEKIRDKIKGVFITHGHEDHIGALPYLLAKYNFPLYGGRLTLALVKSKLKEHGLANKAVLHHIEAGQVTSVGLFSVEWIPVNHSIPDAYCLAVRTPIGYVVHTGDFKIDCTPISGQMIDLARLGAIGNEGVLALMSDSTNAERAGYTPSERVVGESFTTLFKKAENKRIIIATFSSNLHRIQQIIDAAANIGRKVAVSGRSMINFVAIATELGYLQVPQGLLIDIDAVSRYAKGEVIIITTGSQGEPMSALARMAFSDHRKVEVGPEDCIIISATPIPGNEKTVGKVINELMKLGCVVVYEKMYDVHVSGHACREELKIVLGLTKPKYFIPIHGEQKHLKKHAELALSMGIASKNIMITDIGRVIELSPKKMETVGTVQAGRVLVDGLGVGDVGSIVLRERKHLAEDGLIVVVASIDPMTGQLLSGPDIVSRGFVYVKESEKMMDEAKTIARLIILDCLTRNAYDLNSMKNRLKEELSHKLFQKIKRSPMILPIIMDV